jgi:hypothetical protein
MTTLRLIRGAAVAAAVATTLSFAAPARAAAPAADDAAQPPYAAGWLAGQNGGAGFGPWIFFTQITQPNEGAGHFMANAGPNPDLNFIQTGGTGRAWGMFANEAFTGGNDLQLAAAIRAFQSPLLVGETFGVSFEHALIQSGNLNPEFGPRLGGWVGVTLRSGTMSQFIADPLQPFGNISGSWGFGFQGGDQTYKIYDSLTPSGRPTAVPFTADGLRVEFTLLEQTDVNSYNYRAVIRSARTGVVLDTITGPVGGVLDAFGLYNRNAELADVFFNSLFVVGPSVPCCTGNGDKVAPGLVEFGDVVSVLANFGAGYGITGPGDSNCDGNVNFDDVVAVLANFGTACN